MQRMRIQFSRGEAIKFISHLDVVRLWERALRRAGVPLAYSQGFSPHPQISLAVPLAVGMTSEAELMDITCTRSVSPQWFMDIVNQQLPPDIRVLQAHQISPTLPSLQSQARFAEFRVSVNTEKSREDIEGVISNLLSLSHLPWQHQRDTGVKSYDLRVLIDDLWLIDWQPGRSTIGMRLRCDAGGSGRPEQVAAALGFKDHPEVIHRTRLILEAGSKYVSAQRTASK